VVTHWSEESDSLAHPEREQLQHELVLGGVGARELEELVQHPLVLRALGEDVRQHQHRAHHLHLHHHLGATLKQTSQSQLNSFAGVFWHLRLEQLRVVFQQKVETRVQVDAQRV
jgi:hypothetical protein